jgi:hypothetical protein
MTFQWDPDKARINLRRHRVDFSDATTVFEDPRALTRDDPHPREERLVTSDSMLWDDFSSCAGLHETTSSASSQPDARTARRRVNTTSNHSHA